MEERNGNPEQGRDYEENEVEQDGEREDVERDDGATKNDRHGVTGRGPVDELGVEDRPVDDPTDRGRHNTTGDTPERAYDHRTGKGFDERAGERMDHSIDRVTGESTGERIGNQLVPTVDDFGLNRPPRKP